MEEFEQRAHTIQSRLNELEKALAELPPERRKKLNGAVSELRQLTGSSLTHAQQPEIATALRENETMFKNLFDFAPNAIIAVDEHGLILQTNRQAEVLFGYSHAELVGQPVDILMPKNFHHRHQLHIEQYSQYPRPRPMGVGLELYGRHKNGKVFPVDITLGPIELPSGLITMAAIKDITDSQRAEEAIRERDQFFQTTLSLTPMMFFKVTRDGTIQLSIGASPAQSPNGDNLTGQSIYQVFAEHPHVIEHFERTINGESFTVLDEVGQRLFHTSFAPQQNERGEIVAAVGVSLDITEYKQLAEALSRSEARFHMVFNQATLGLVLLDENRQVVESNPAYQQMLGYTAEELGQKSLADYTYPDDYQEQEKLLNRLYQGKQTHVVFEKRYRHKNGDLLWGRVALSVLRNEQAEPLLVLGIVENITQQKKLQTELEEVHRRLIDSTEREQLLLSQELHDGPLQDLQAAIFQLSALDESPHQAALDETQAILVGVAASVRAICGELRPPALAPFGLEKALRSYLAGMREKHPEIEFVSDLKPDGRALQEPVRLALFRIFQHSLANVIKHAQARRVEVTFDFDEQQVWLKVSDDGNGFRPPRRWIELVRRGHYGLAGSFERAEAIGGTLKVDSQPGRGTSILVTAPRAGALPEKS